MMTDDERYIDGAALYDLHALRTIHDWSHNHPDDFVRIKARLWLEKHLDTLVWAYLDYRSQELYG